MASGTDNLPNQDMEFNPFDPLPASQLNDMVENIEAVADGSGIGDEAITTAALGQGAVTSRNLSSDIVFSYAGSNASTNLVLTHDAKVLFMFSANISNSTTGTDSYAYLRIGGVDKITLRRRNSGTNNPDIVTSAGFIVESLAAGTHVISTTGAMTNTVSWVAVILNQ
jgi:hypothetical protein